MMKYPAMIIGLILLATGAFSQPAGQESMMERANQSYSSDDYAAAISDYESVIASGYESPALYFNLGNAHFKLNNIPAAILYYEKAMKLDPTDENIRFNLDLANSRITDKIEPLPEFFLKTWWRSARDMLSSDQWAKTGVAGFILALASIAFFIISRSVSMRKIAFWTGMTFLVLLTVSILFSISGYHDYSRQSSAIVFSPTVTVKSSPNESSVDLFVIHEGTKVTITDLVEGWSEVRLANGNVGWVKNDTFRRI
ncbi:MAG: tetratricopeptide repeat protein [Bacteroidales bacterium]|nr:tetratricopeptide repeat protein [Bacteroidales bacterium]